MEGVVRRLAYWGFRPDGATGDEPQNGSRRVHHARRRV